MCFDSIFNLLKRFTDNSSFIFMQIVSLFSPLLEFVCPCYVSPKTVYRPQISPWKGSKFYGLNCLEKTEWPKTCYWFNVVSVLYELYFWILLTTIIIHTTFLFLDNYFSSEWYSQLTLPKNLPCYSQLVLKVMFIEKMFQMKKM